ncbi:MAG: preprotein translocase subunit SecE [Clostridia bacterium]|nr:preprotein translocase subunit SecE [Clostridia bacterium]
MKEEKTSNSKVESKKVSAKNKKDNIFKKIGRKFKEVFSELKKVSWPDVKTIAKNTGIVLGVVALFLVVITLIDLGFGELFKLITGIGG